jgi:hypothetical protein
MTLTEQLKKGELNTGWYYLKTEKETSIGLYSEAFGHKIWTLRPMENVEEVLSLVPSYEEYQQLHKFLEEFNALDVAKENQQLKELLKECQYMIFAYSINHDTFTKEKVLDVVTKIDNAIGEKK